MKRLLSWLAMCVVGVVVVVFSISNRTIVTLDFWPLPWFQDVPLYVPVMIAGFFGFLFGGTIAWFSAGRTRSKARQASRRATGLEKDLTVLQQKIDELDEQRKQERLGSS